MKVTKIEGEFGVVELDNVKYKAGLQLLNDVKAGDYVIVHAGFAIEKVDEKEALEIYDLLRSVEEKK